MKELRDILVEFGRAREPMALATIVKTTGSSYRKPGARMLILPRGWTIGVLSGGCIEEEVAQRALPVMATGETTVFDIDTRLRFGCHGTITLFVERIEPGNVFLSYLRQCFAQREEAQVGVIYEGLRQCGTFPMEDVAPGTTRFEQTIPPPIRLIIVGDGPGNDALVGLTRILGWDVEVVDRLQGAGVVADNRTAVLIKNHHFGRDFAALRWALGQPFGYVGLLGSQKRKSELMDALMGEGWVPMNSGLRHFYGPAGLDLGAEQPEEIALSIMAEIQAALAAHEGGFLRDRKRPIHEVTLCPTALQ